MAKVSWELSGEYCETCSCDYVCPCLPTAMAGKPTKGWCVFAFAFQVAKGHYGKTKLGGLNFAVVGRSPGIMGQGNWSVGLIIDQRAKTEQEQAITAIASGQAGGPMAALAPLIGTFLGVEKKPVRFEKNGMRRAVSVPDLLDQALEGVAGGPRPKQPLFIDNTLHPANSRLALARARHSHLHALGLDWDDTTGGNNGHFAPFRWRGASQG